MYQQHHERLANDRRVMDELATSTSIISFEAEGAAPDRYTLIFHGKAPCSDAVGRVEVIDEHRCLLRLPFAYPNSPPDVQWLTPLLHPNVGYGGFVHLEDVGLEWHADMGLDVVCERLWDVARLAYINQQNVVNSSAVGYLAQSGWNLPLDDRPLRDRSARQLKNIVRYKRRPGTMNEVEMINDMGEVRPAAASRGDDVLYIGDEEAE